MTPRPGSGRTTILALVAIVTTILVVIVVSGWPFNPVPPHGLETGQLPSPGVTPASTTPRSPEPTTLVEFQLVDAGASTRLTVTESGFDRIPAARRDEARRMNEGGWAAQVENIKRYVEGD